VNDDFLETNKWLAEASTVLSNTETMGKADGFSCHVFSGVLGLSGCETLLL